MPRLLIPIVSAIRGGAEEYAGTIARHAAADGFEVQVLVSDRPAMSAYAEELREAGIAVHRLAIEEAGVRRPARFRASRTRRALSAIRPDVVLLTLPEIRFGIGILEQCIRSGIPACAVYQLIRWEQWTPAVGERLAGVLAHPLIRPVVVSEFDREQLHQRVNVGADSVTVIHNGVDLLRFARPAGERAAARSGLRRALGLDADAAVLLGVGRLDEQKGCDLMLAALPKLARKHPDVHLVWAGEGPDRPNLTRAAEIMGIADRVHWLGRRTDIPDLLSAADGFVFPSRFEGLPFALLEAMAACVPVVASDIPPVREAVGGEDAAVLVRADDAYHLRRGIERVLADGDAWRARAAVARERVQRFSLKAMCGRTLDLLRVAMERADG